jgi:hypothetical protein
MKKILLCLAILAVFAAANTCTEAWFKINSIGAFANKDEPRLDSVYSKQDESEWTKKYFYSDGLVDSMAQVSSVPAEVSEYKFYHNAKLDDIRKTGNEIIITDTISNGTTFSSQLSYVNGIYQNRTDFKRSDSYASSTMARSINETSVTEYFFSNDTLFFKSSFEHKMILDADPSNWSLVVESYLLGDPKDDSKCYQYRDSIITDTLFFQNNEKGFSVKIVKGNNLTEYFMVYPEGFTAIRKQRPAVKILPKARYFDLLGRYKYTR